MGELTLAASQQRQTSHQARHNHHDDVQRWPRPTICKGKDLSHHHERVSPERPREPTTPTRFSVGLLCPSGDSAGQRRRKPVPSSPPGRSLPSIQHQPPSGWSLLVPAPTVHIFGGAGRHFDARLRLEHTRRRDATWPSVLACLLAADPDGRDLPDVIVGRVRRRSALARHRGVRVEERVIGVVGLRVLRIAGLE